MNKKIIKVCIFDKGSTPSQVIQTNGDAILDNICIECKTEEYLETGEYYLDAIFSLDKEGLYKYIHEEAILKVYLDYGYEYFRIAKIKRNIHDITVFARQETIYQTLHMWLSDVRPENQSGQGALNWIKDNSVGPKNINVLSDINILNTAYYVDMNMYTALHNCDQSFKNRWGGEVQRRGYNLSINKKIGMHRGIQIRSNKNLKGFESNTDIDDVFTRLKPRGFDGITIDGFVDSKLINTYPFIKTIAIKYDDVKVKSENNKDEGYDTLEEAQVELIRRSNLEFTENHIDKIRADYKINFIQLEQTEEYKNYILAERVYLGDEIDVYEEKFDINITVRLIIKKFDVLKQRTIEIDLSNEVVKNKPPGIGDILDELDKNEVKINKIKVDIDSELGQIEITIKDEVKGLQTQITSNTEGIYSKVNNSEFESYKIQTAGLISQKVTSGEVSAIIQHDPYSVNIGFNGINNVIQMIAQGMRVNHGNNYSLLSGNGLMRYDGGTGREYHHLMHQGTVYCNSEQYVRINLPQIFHGKRINAVASAACIGTGNDAWDKPEPLVSFWAEVNAVCPNSTWVEFYASTRQNRDGTILTQHKGIKFAYWITA